MIQEALLRHGWIIFYKIVIVYLIQFKEQILSEDQDNVDTLVALTSNNYQTKEQRTALNWSQIVSQANSMQLDDDSITNLLQNFDLKKLNFKF